MSLATAANAIAASGVNNGASHLQMSARRQARLPVCQRWQA